MSGMGDRIQQAEQVTMALGCGFCGGLATKGHDCPEGRAALAQLEPFSGREPKPTSFLTENQNGQENPED